MNGEIFPLDLADASAVELERDDALSRDLLVEFEVICGEDTVDVEAVVVALTDDTVGVPVIVLEAVASEEGFRFCAVDDLTAVLVKNATPPVFSDISLVSDDDIMRAFFTEGGSVLDTAVDESRSGVSAESELTGKHEIPVLFFGVEVGVARHFLSAA